MYTGYYSKYREYVDTGLLPVSISRFTPPTVPAILHFEPFKPSEQLLWRWKRDASWSDFVAEYRNTVLAPMVFTDTIRQLAELCPLEGMILMCYEGPNEHCHRHIVSAWLNEHGIDCSEYRFDANTEKIHMDLL